MTNCTVCNHTTATFGIEDSKTSRIKWHCYVCYMEIQDERKKDESQKLE